MGTCFSHSDHRLPPRSSSATGDLLPPLVLGSSRRLSKARSSRDGGGVLTDEEALAAAALLLRHSVSRNGGGGNFDRSVSVRAGGGGNLTVGRPLPRSSSTRPRSVADPLVEPQQLINKEVNVNNLETNHFVLIHGGGLGAWCWYKTIALLEDAGFKVNAIDLAGAGIHYYDTNGIGSLSQYVKPLTCFLEKLRDGEKVILVGHDFGGACISYAMEASPTKIAKAIFVTAAMPTNGQSTLDVFAQKEGTSDLMREAQVFVYANGKDRPPTAIDLDKALLKDLLFNQSPAKDVALASVSMRPIPFSPVLEKLSLTEKYASVRRFFIEATEDNAIPLSLQQSLCSSNPPEKVFRIKGSDHSPFFSKPQALHKLLVEISKVPAVQGKLTTQNGVARRLSQMYVE